MHDFTRVANRMLEDVKIFELFVASATKVMCRGPSQECAELVSKRDERILEEC